MKTVIYSLIALSTLISRTTAADKGAQDASTEESTSITADEATPPQESDQQSSQVVADYIALKDALVRSNSQEAQEAAGKLMSSLAKARLNPGITEAANSIADSQNLETQRENFKTITDKLIETYKAKGDKAGLYVQYCPMAFGNMGASWLSTSEEIRNPYFGDKMLKCGKVTEEI